MTEWALRLGEGPGLLVMIKGDIFQVPRKLDDLEAVSRHWKLSIEQ